MESNAFALRTALFTLLGGALLLASYLLLTRNQGEYRVFVVKTDQSVSGLALQSRVYYKGVEVGLVQDIFFADGDFDQVQILIQVDSEIPIARNTYAQLALRGITGEYDLRLDNDGALGDALVTSDTTPAQIPMRPHYIEALGDATKNTLGDIQRASEALSAFLDEQTKRKLTDALDSVADAADQLARIEGKLTPSLELLPGVINTMDETILEYQTLAQSLSAQTNSLGPTLDRFAAAADQLEQLAGTVQSRTLVTTETTLASLNRSSNLLSQWIEEMRRDPQRLLLGAPDHHLGPGEHPREQRK